MMNRVIKEKFQITVPYNDNDNDTEQWASDQVNRLDFPQNYLTLPPGEIKEPALMQMTLSLAGETDVSPHVHKKALLYGFTKHDMMGHDDQYTGEHVDLFYGDSGGFVERNNMLDRE